MLNLCDAECTTAQSDPDARIEIHLGCPTTYEATPYTQIYEPVCPPGTQVQWGYLTYLTETPLDSSVVFSARTAWTSAQLAGGFTQLAIAQANPDTQACTMTSPGCPIDMYNTLGLPAARLPVLELQVMLNPSTNAMASPSLSDWDITYSCPPSE